MLCRESVVSVSVFPSAAPRRSFDPLELYASAIDTSDYVARVAPLVRRFVPRAGELLDVGAGGGQLGTALRQRGVPWTAIEPSPTMQARLARLHGPPRVVPRGWEAAAVADQAHDTVLAATMPALFDEPERFLDRCRAWARAASALRAACPRRGTARTRRRASTSCCAACRWQRGRSASSSPTG